MKINYHGRKFAGVFNTPNGQVNSDTVFRYKQHDQILTATYDGGRIQQGSILGIVREDNSLAFVYHHVDTNGNLKSGQCVSTPELLDDGRIRLHEKWEWTYGGSGKGESVVEEI